MAAPATQTTITLSIAGRVYRMACGPGEEDHLRQLGRRLEAKINELRESFGEIGDQRITVMAALTLADQLSEAEQRLAQLETDVSSLKEGQASAGAAAEAAENAVASAIEEAATRIDGVARSMLAGVRP